MKEVLLCKANFQNADNDRRVILFLNECLCGRKYCQENVACTVKNILKKISLRETAVEFLVEYKKQQSHMENYVNDFFLQGHVHLNKTLLQELAISKHEIEQMCKEMINSLGQKKKNTHHLKRTTLSVRESCCFGDSCGSKESGMMCLMFSYYNADDPNLERAVDVLCNQIYPVLMETVTKGDPRIFSANIIWKRPEKKSPNGDASKGEWVLDVIADKYAVKKSGDALRVVIDACLPVLHLIDTRHSIPYSVKQVQEFLGIASAFEQVVQRLSTSVRKVSKGVLKEHIVLLANHMTCSGNLLGFNAGGYKALTKSLDIKAPFTEATLINPMKCFDKASERCHKDPLSYVVGSCSWGKHVAVGTGSGFDLLWNKNELQTNLSDERVDPYSFLQMVRSCTDGNTYVDSSGFDVLEQEIEECEGSPERYPALEVPTFEELLDEGELVASKWEQVSLGDKGSCSGSSKDGAWEKPNEEDANNGSAWGSAIELGQCSWEKPNKESGKSSGQDAWEKLNDESNKCDEPSWGSPSKGKEIHNVIDPWTLRKEPDSNTHENHEDDSNPWVALADTRSRDENEKQRSQWGNPNKRFPSEHSQGNLEAKRNPLRHLELERNTCFQQEDNGWTCLPLRNRIFYQILSQS